MTSTHDSTPLVIFIHGLNTFGDDLIHAGPLTFGPMFKFWKPALESKGFEFHSLNEMGYGLFDEQIDRAMTQIERLLRARNVGPENVHLFGHSMGGLVARGVAKRMRAETPELARVRSVITIGSPHFGSRAADGALELPKTSPQLTRLMKLFGYNIEERGKAFTPLLIDKIRDFNSRHPLMTDVDCVSLVGAAKRHQIGLPYQVIYNLLHTPGLNELSDGLVLSDSQRWGRIAGEFELDHMAQLGSFLYLGPRARLRAQRELSRALQTVEGIIRTNSRPDSTRPDSTRPDSN